MKATWGVALRKGGLRWGISGMRAHRAAVDGDPVRTSARRSVASESRPHGLPPVLRAQVEKLSGVDLSGVVVHRGSDRPARVGAEAYTKGQDIYLGPSGDQHLPHEAWHVVQQATTRIAATTREGGVPINDDERLEREADAMGTQATRIQRKTYDGERLEREADTIGTRATRIQRTTYDGESLAHPGVKGRRASREPTVGVIQRNGDDKQAGHANAWTFTKDRLYVIKVTKKAEADVYANAKEGDIKSVIPGLVEQLDDYDDIAKWYETERTLRRPEADEGIIVIETCHRRALYPTLSPSSLT